MEFPLSSQIAANFEFVPQTGSTNADLVAQAPDLPDFSILVAGFQSAGRGRAGRDWLAPAGSSLFVSVLLKPKNLLPSSFSWLPLLAGLAMTKTVAQFVPDRAVSLKWPNDVLVSEQKISGVLSELIADQSGVVIGAGLNILQSKEELPIASATSLAIEGASNFSRDSNFLDEILESYLKNLKALYSAWVEAGGDAVLSGLRNEVIAACSTIGRGEVKAILPGDKELFAEAIGIDDTGRLILQPAGSKDVTAVAAGDIVHLRHN